MRRLLIGVLSFALTVVSPALAQVRGYLPVPDVPGFKTMKGDFHMHTVFSDGEVWPTVRVSEAWRDGLDVIAITDHNEYRPYSRDVKPNTARPYELAKPLADQLGLILIPGVEITKTFPYGPIHFNALFVTDPEALNVPDLNEALRRAAAQNAFVFWNHPGWQIPKIEWFPPIAAAYQEKLFQGMELANGAEFYADAYPWIEEKGLTILSNSDQHQPMPPRAVGGIRTITLLFVHNKDSGGVREALAARRTAAWMGNEIWGADEFLLGLWQGAVQIENPDLKGRPGTPLTIRVRNTSAIPFRLVVRRSPSWLRMEGGAIAAEAESSLFPFLASDAPVGVQHVEMELEILNFHTRPGRNLTVRLPLVVNVAP